MITCPDRDCAHLRCEYSPVMMNNEVVGATLTDWCCDLDGGQSCGTEDCPTDRRYGNMSKARSYWWNQGQYA